MPILSIFFGINWDHAQNFEPLERIPGADQDD
jgi:hypothetical protein